MIPDAINPKLASLLAEPGVTDLLVNGYDQVWVQRRVGHLEACVSPFDSESELAAVAQDLIASGGRHLDQANPFADVVIGESIRVHACLASVCHPKTLLSIRIHLARAFALAELQREGMLGDVEFSMLKDILVRRENFLIAGPAGSGKTTLLRAMLAECVGERIIAVEDVAEIALTSGHFISLQTRQANIEGAGEIDLDRLVREALRMRPDRLAVGEIRGLELLAMLQGLNTGHSGGGATIHANGFEAVCDRLIAIGWQAGWSSEAVMAQARTAIHWLIYLGFEHGKRRVLQIGKF
ncbi:MAG: CpaF family protein [Rhodoluna sp.]